VLPWIRERLPTGLTITSAVSDHSTQLTQPLRSVHALHSTSTSYKLPRGLVSSTGVWVARLVSLAEALFTSCTYTHTHTHTHVNTHMLITQCSARHQLHPSMITQRHAPPAPWISPPPHPCWDAWGYAPPGSWQGTRTDPSAAAAPACAAHSVPALDRVADIHHHVDRGGADVLGAFVELELHEQAGR